MKSLVARWEQAVICVEESLRIEVPIPVISMAVMHLFASRDKGDYAWRAIAMMRHGFGGHPFGSSEAIRHERLVGKVKPVRRAA